MAYIAETMSQIAQTLKETNMTERDVRKSKNQEEQIEVHFTDADYSDDFRADPLTTMDDIKEERDAINYNKQQRANQASAEAEAKAKAEQEEKEKELERLREFERNNTQKPLGQQ